MNIVVEGRERFRLLELKGGRSFKTGLVEPVDDEAEPVEPATSTRALEVFRELAEVADSDVDFPPADSELLDFELAARVDFGADAKQELLASTSPRARMARLVELLEQSIEALRRSSSKLRERAGRQRQGLVLFTLIRRRSRRRRGAHRRLRRAFRRPAPRRRLSLRRTGCGVASGRAS